MLGYTNQEWSFAVATTGVVMITWYLTEPVGERMGSSIVAGTVFFVVILAVMRIANESVKQLLLDLLSLFP